ncbi:DUF262 domain-containing protein [Streptomyces sp. SID14515]|uniref:DUF262 domain-containing protein n=1 Tax=Streptomyces sp. SID14515 TaxID=2706074 RepID=UPI0013C70778|nr:DUF262 domain-containing protein [Streptomyces sp. SID14515]NEB42457.1 DUF262 domain-containing protein [Streptomyces sp. SID14515]
MTSEDIYSDLDIEDEIDEDSEEDLGSDETVFKNITTYTVDWSVTTVIERMERGAIDVSPTYQRNPVWNKAKTWRFLESLMVGIPVPQLVLAAKKEARSKFVVLDGKQRLLALKFAADLQKEGNKLKFPKLEILPGLQGKTLKKVLEDDRLSDHWESLLVQPIRTVVVQGYSDERALHAIFHRLNQNSVSLSSHELRRALHMNDFMLWLDEFSATSEPLRRARRIKQPDFRMRDAETALRHFAFSRSYASYQGDLRKFLDEEAKWAGKSWAHARPLYEEMGRSLNIAIDAAFDIFGSTTFFRYTGEKYLPRFNSPLFDVVTASLKDESLRQACFSRKPQLKEAVEELSVDREFSHYITSTTKSQDAVQGRFRLWAEMLESVTGQSDVLAKMVG